MVELGFEVSSSNSRVRVPYCWPIGQTVWCPAITPSDDFILSRWLKGSPSHLNFLSGSFSQGYILWLLDIFVVMAGTHSGKWTLKVSSSARVLLACNPQRHFTYTNFKANYIHPDMTGGHLPRSWQRWQLAVELFLMMFNSDQTRKNVQTLQRLFTNSSCGHWPASNSANYINTALSAPMESISSSSPSSTFPPFLSQPSSQETTFLSHSQLLSLLLSAQQYQAYSLSCHLSQNVPWKQRALSFCKV